MLERCAAISAASAVDALRAGAEFTAAESESLPGEHFAAIYRRRRRHLASTDADVPGLDDAIDGFERADEVAGLVTIMGADRHYLVFMAPRAVGAVVACLSTPAK